MRKTLLKTTLVLSIIFLFLATFFIITPKITGNSIAEKMSTKAICDDNNYCEDYEIVCEKKQVKSFTPTGFSIQNPTNWHDSRTPEQIDEMCD